MSCIKDKLMRIIGKQTIINENVKRIKKQNIPNFYISSHVCICMGEGDKKFTLKNNNAKVASLVESTQNMRVRSCIYYRYIIM